MLLCPNCSDWQTRVINLNNQTAGIGACCALVEHLALSREILANVHQVLQLLSSFKNLIDALH